MTTLSDIDILADERLNGNFSLTPEEKIINTMNAMRGVLQLAHVQALCRELIAFGSLNTFEDVSKCFVQAWYEVVKDKPMEEIAPQDEPLKLAHKIIKEQNTEIIDLTLRLKDGNR